MNYYCICFSAHGQLSPGVLMVILLHGACSTDQEYYPIFSHKSNLAPKIVMAIYICFTLKEKYWFLFPSVMCKTGNGKKTHKKHCKKHLGSASRPKRRRKCDKKPCKFGRCYYVVIQFLIHLIIVSYIKHIV